MSITADQFSPPQGRLPALQFMAPGELAIDPSYQRSIGGEDSQRLIGAIAREWNWDLCLPLVVSRRPDGSLYVIDGQHRLEAARLRGDIAHLPCVVGNYGDAAAEADNFVRLNQRRRPLTRLDLFRAAVASGDAQAIAIDKALGDAGLVLAPHMTAAGWKPGMVGNIGGIEAAWKKWGPNVASEALQCLATAFAGQVLRYAGSIYPGIVAVCVQQCRDGCEFPSAGFARFTAALDRVGQKSLRQQIVMLSADPDTSRPEAAAEAIRKVWEGCAPPAQPLPSAAPTYRPGDGAARPLDRYDLRARGKAQFCEQCDRLATPGDVASCGSKWCSLRDAA